MVLKVSWIKILFIKLTSSSKHSLMLSKTGIEVHLMHEFMPPEPFLVLGQRTCPIDYFRSKTHVFGWFHAIYSMHPTRCGNWYCGSFDWPFQNSRTLDILLERFQCTPLGPKLICWVFSPFRCSKTSIRFHTTYFRSKTRVLDGFTPFCYRTGPIAKISISVHLMH